MTFAHSRQLHLNAFLMSTGHHEASWRLPESDPHAGTNIQHYQQLARTAERGKLDSIFFADSPVLFGEVGRRPAGKLEPTVLLTAIAGATERIGLIATASTTYNEPFNLARRFASVDWASGGRTGRGPELRCGRPACPCRPVRARRRIHRGLAEAVGQLAGRCRAR